jgi:hypothetical protein
MALPRARSSLRALESCNICRDGHVAIPRFTQSRSYATPISAAAATATATATASGSSSTSSNKAGGAGGIPNPSAYAVFDRATKVKQKNRAVRRDIEHSRLTDYVKDEIAANLVERLLVSKHPHTTM